MSQDAIREALELLGLGAATVGEGDPLPEPPPDDQLEGNVAALAGADEALEGVPVGGLLRAPAPHLLLPLRLRALEESALEVGVSGGHRDRFVVLGDGLRVLSEGVDVRLPRGGVAIAWGTLLAPVALVDREARGALVVPRAGERPWLYRLDLRESLASFRRPEALGAWIEACSDDWVRERAGALHAQGTDWSALVAMGALDRLPIPTGEEAAEALQRWLAGAPPPRPARDFCRALPARTRGSVVAWAMRAAELWARRMDALEERVRPEDSEWHEDMLETLRERDDLEGIRGLFAGRVECEPLDGLLDDLDDRGRRVMRALPEVEGVEEDPQLRRAALADPSAWWCAGEGRLSVEEDMEDEEELL